MLARNDSKTAELKKLLDSPPCDNAAAMTLIAEGADPESTDNQGKNALHWAAFSGDLAAVEWLVKVKKLNVHTRSLQGNTPLYFACLNGQLACAKSLVALGADLTDLNNNHQTLLYAAVMSNNLELITWLVESKKIDLAARDKNNSTILAVNPNMSEPVKNYLAPLFLAAHQAKQAAAANDKKFQLFKQKHEMSLDHSGIFKAIKMRDLLTKLNTQQALDNFDMQIVKDHAMNRPDSLTAEVLRTYRGP